VTRNPHRRRFSSWRGEYGDRHLRVPELELDWAVTKRTLYIDTPFLFLARNPQGRWAQIRVRLPFLRKVGMNLLLRGWRDS